MSIYNAYVAIGLPGVGKSTLQKTHFPNASRVSSDDFIEAYAAEQEKTYDEVFKEYIKTANKLFFERLQNLVDNRCESIYVDRTNMSVKARKRIMKILDGYRIHCFVVTCEETEHARRLDSRVGKTIPDSVLFSMQASYEPPTVEEGFSTIQVVHYG